MAGPVPSGAGTSSGHRAPAETPRRRNTELLLLVFAVALVTGALALVEANQEQTLSGQVAYYGLVYLALLAVAHVVVRRYAPYADPLILPCVALLNGLGLVMIHRLDLADAEQSGAAVGIFTGAAARQVLWTFIGIGLFVAVLVLIRDHRTLARYGYTFGLAGLFALALPGLLPASISEVNGSKAWLKFGVFSLQPGEFAKILLMIFFAAFLVAKRDLFLAAGRRFLGLELPRARDLGPLIVAFAGAVGVLVLEKDLGNSLLVFGVVLVMLYVATERAAWLIIGLVPFIGACYLAYNLFGHVQERVANWIDPFADYNGSGYQMAQSLFGLGTGGVGGTGLGAGRPDIVPLANSDFIVAAIGEELGFIGLAALLLIYTLLALRGLRSALAVRDTFGKLLGGGLAFSIAWQVFVVVGGVTKLIPETGLTSPFLSAGGSSLLANYMLIALLLRISDTARRPQGSSKPRVAQVPLADAGTVMVERPQ